MQIATRIQGVTGGGALQWRPVVVPQLSGGYPAKIVYGNGRWLMLAFMGGYYAPFVSADNGETWVMGTFAPLTGYGGPAVEYLPDAGLFVCTNVSAFFTSADGLMWNWYSPPGAIANAHHQGVFKGKLLGCFSNKSTRTTDGFSWTAAVTLPSNPSGGSYDYTKPLACSPDRALYIPNSPSYWATDDGVSFALQSAPAGVIFGNPAYGFGQFFVTDSTGAVPTNKLHKSTSGLTGSWQTMTLPAAIERGSCIDTNDAAVVALSQFPTGGLPPKAALSLDGGNSWEMTGPCGTAQIQPRALKGVGRRFIAAGPSVTPPYSNNTIYILDVP